MSSEPDRRIIDLPANRNGEPGWNGSRRVERALRHQESDRIPLDIGGTRVTGIHLQAYHGYRARLGLPPSKPELQVRYLQLPRVEEDFRSVLGVDLESIDPDTLVRETETKQDGNGGARYTDMWGCGWYMPKDGAYFDLSRFPLAEAESLKDLERYNWPPGDDPAMLFHMAEQAREIRDGHRRAIVLGRTSPGIFEMCSVLCGYEKAMMDLAGNPALSEAIMDRVLEHKFEYYRAAIGLLRSAGVEFFIISESDDLGSQSGLLVSPQMYRRLVKPRHTRLFEMIKDCSGGRAAVELHCCGAIREILPDLIEAGVEVLNPVQVSAAGMDTAELKREFGNSIVFHGGGVDSQATLPYGTPAEVRDEVRRRIEDLAPGGGFIFTPVHSIQLDVPVENFMAMIETFYEYA